MRDWDDPLVKLLRAEEGLLFEPYKDHLGYWTIGVGHLIDARRGGTLKGVTIPLDLGGALALLVSDIEEKVTALELALPWVKDLDSVRKTVLISMAFQMGVAGVLGFQKTLRNVRDGLYGTAADGMLGSLWAKQTPGRAGRLARMMREG